MKGTDRARSLDITRVVVVHSVDISPYLDFLGIDSRAYKGGRIVAAAPF